MIVGGSAAIAAGLHRFVHARLPALVVTSDDDLPNKLIGVLTGMFGLMLAFVVVSQYQDLKEAEFNVRSEANHLEQLHIDAKTFDPEVKEEVELLIGRYLHILVEVEWDLMRDGRGTEQASLVLSEIDDVIQAFEPETNAQNAFYTNAVAELDEIRELRRHRLEEAAEELPAELFLVIVFGAMLLIFFLGCFGAAGSWAHTVMVMAVAALVGFNLLLLITLDHPFSGEISVSSHVFEQGDLASLF
jgi:hypothetical protein